MSIANEPETKTGTVCEIQEPDQRETSASEIDRLEMLAALEEKPAKAMAAEVSANAGNLPTANQSDVLSSDAQFSEVSAAHALDLTAVATRPSSIALIELAQILDEHKMWVESGGETGTKADLTGANLTGADLTGVNLQDAILTKANLTGADLSMANLRGTNLVHADLRNATLLGTELRGANLMGATLYGAEGLWVGRLGGTNLFDALLPESVAEFSSTNPIADASKIARFFYFTTLAVSAICCLMIVFTTDARLLLNTSALPAYLGNALPMTGFYLGAPLVLFALYLRFHFLLLRLWGSIAALPAVFPDGQTPERDGPWFLMGLIRKHFRWLRDGRSPLAVLETAISMALGYWIVPATLLLFWVRYLVRQDFRGTLLQVLLITVSVAAATGLPDIVSRVLRSGELRIAKSKTFFRLTL
ncbi:MAG TPA: pentapeptide repeat-containing protein, partial [Candidatus Eremiobacteraceae bacterium]|nr:pentapeptide repeat-containing protein [Candidatus Eremiobacteraceae bacterium]